MYMSSLNMLPSAPSEKLYPELLSGNFRLSRIDDIEKQISEESRTTEKSPKDTRKHWLPCATPPSVWAFSRPLSQLLVLPWALHALESLLAPLLVLLEHFVVLDLLCLQTLAKPQPGSFKTRKNLLIAKHNSINACFENSEPFNNYWFCYVRQNIRKWLIFPKTSQSACVKYKLRDIALHLLRDCHAWHYVTLHKK